MPVARKRMVANEATPRTKRRTAVGNVDVKHYQSAEAFSTDAEESAQKSLRARSARILEKSAEGSVSVEPAGQNTKRAGVKRNAAANCSEAQDYEQKVDIKVEGLSEDSDSRKLIANAHWEQRESPAGIRRKNDKRAKRKRGKSEENTLAKDTLRTESKNVMQNQTVERSDDKPAKKSPKKRKTKEEKDLEAMPLAPRTNELRMFIGAHVSGAKGVHNSVTNAAHIGANAFAMFLKSQRKWENPPLQDDHRDLFKRNCNEHRYESANHVLPHGSYLVNLAQEEPDKAKQAYDAFLNDLERCEALGIKLYNFHPGWTGSAPRPLAIGRIAAALNRAHAATQTVVPVIEAMAGSGNVIGSSFEDLRDIITLVEDKSRVGVCIDTCHIFAAGYDLRSPMTFKRTLEQFDAIVGLKYLRALHLNDSKAPFASHRDLHQNIGLGFLGLRAFHNIMNEVRFEGLPLILETPIDHKDDNGKDVEDKGVWAREIKMLEGLVGMNVDSVEYRSMEDELANKGAADRKKFEEAFEKKKAKEKKGAEKGQARLNFSTNRKTKKDSERSSGRE